MKSNSRDPRTYAIIGAAMEVHSHLGSGFLEPIYQEALEIELADRQIPFQPQLELSVRFKGHILQAEYKPDFICYEGVVVEIKALSKLSSNEEAQIINYLKATGIEVGLLINFGSSSLEYRRFVRSHSSSAKSAQSADQLV
jgi:GxxExxY protein